MYNCTSFAYPKSCIIHINMWRIIEWAKRFRKSCRVPYDLIKIYLFLTCGGLFYLYEYMIKILVVKSNVKVNLPHCSGEYCVRTIYEKKKKLKNT